jgi:hypothetical protein
MTILVIVCSLVRIRENLLCFVDQLEHPLQQENSSSKPLVLQDPTQYLGFSLPVRILVRMPF